MTIYEYFKLHGLPNDYIDRFLIGSLVCNLYKTTYHKDPDLKDVITGQGQRYQAPDFLESWLDLIMPAIQEFRMKYNDLINNQGDLKVNE